MPEAISAWVGIGANLGDPVGAVRAALEALAQLPQCQLLCSSSLYRTAPFGDNCEGQPDYINAVACLSTSLTPQELLAALFAIEQAFGRTRSFRNAARTLDLDVLLHGDTQLHTPGLHIPHPRMAERAFVLLPLAEVAPELNIPGMGSLASLLARLPAAGIERLASL